MRDRASGFFLVSCVLAIFGMAVSTASAQLASQTPAAGVASMQAAPLPEVKGKLSEIEGVPLVQVWGTPQERGYALGRLVGDKAVTLLDGMISSGRLGGSAEGYEQMILPVLSRMTLEPQYEQELRGLLAGVEAGAAGPVEVPSLKRALKYEDLLAANCIPDFSMMGCSSFSAWGSMTGDGHTITGRNLDWPAVPQMVDSRMIVVHAPCKQTGALGWVSLTWPGYLGCSTGMNSEGVTIAMHDAGARGPVHAGGFTPRSFAHREALEHAKSATAFEDVGKVLRSRLCAVGNNIMVTRAHPENGAAAVVFEYDGFQTLDVGATQRDPAEGEEYIVCTNHHRVRAQPVTCGRYEGLYNGLRRLVSSERKVTQDRAWKLLRGACMSGILTHHSVVFEPDKGLMHVAFSEKGLDAAHCKPLTLNVKELLAGLPAE